MAISATVKCFAALREQVGFAETRVEFEPGATVAELWAMACRENLDPHIKVAINHQYADVTAEVGDGDEVAFFPPVTGG